MPLDRVKPEDIPSQKEMITRSTLNALLREKMLNYSGLEKSQILKDYAWRLSDALPYNVYVISYISDMVSSMLGPKGLDKMVVKDIGEVRPTRKVVITNDASEFLSELEFESPVGRLVKDLSSTLNKEVGDGVASTMVLIGSLLKEALELRKKGIHPNLIRRGYEFALKKSLDFLDSIRQPVDVNNTRLLFGIVLTTIRGKATDFLVELANSLISELSRELISLTGFTATDYYSSTLLNLFPIKVYKLPGNLSESKVIKGVVIRNEIVSRRMLRKIEGARIAVLSGPIVFRDMENTRFSYDNVVYTIGLPKQIQEYSRSRLGLLRSFVKSIKRAGANLVCTRKGLDEAVISAFEYEGISAIRRIVDEDIERIAKATSARVVPRASLISEDDLGGAEIVEEIEVAGQRWIIFDGCKNPQSISVLLRTPSEEIIFDAEHLIRKAVNSLRSLLISPFVVPGGGTAHLEIAVRLREFSYTLGSRLSIVVESYAKALESVSFRIVNNAGFRAWDILNELKSLHALGYTNAGFDVCEGRIVSDVISELLIADPYYVIRRSLQAATEFSNMIISVDQIIFTPTTELESVRKKLQEMEEHHKSPEDWIEEKDVV
jgi:chaperonin GroEL (HSP60 family)